ncbi:hypothetical protein [Azohydromonas australica]|uniref:hypothetical protein n=1 Tax=Azohydromonas australica TaxID=364039 RepID=UPI0006854185|nr:hypothetical protein [Azohydromonas australica]
MSTLHSGLRVHGLLYTDASEAPDRRLVAGVGIIRALMEESPMPRLQAIIPDGLKFEDLALTRDPATGTVRFELDPIQAICEASALDFDALLARDDGAICALIAAWYEDHLKDGGSPDPVLPALDEETRYERERGGGFSYPPGHA